MKVTQQVSGRADNQEHISHPSSGPGCVHTALISQSIKFSYGRLGVHFPGVPAMEGAQARSPCHQNFAWGILAGLLFLTDALHSLCESLLC